MGADASIYGMLRQQPVVRLEDPDEIQAKRMTLRNLMQQSEIGELGIQEKRRGIADDQRIASLFAAGAPTEQAISAINPAKGMAYGKSLADRQNSDATRKKAEAETLAKNVSILRDQLATVNDQAGYDQWREMNARLMGPDFAAKIAPQFDPSKKAQGLHTADTLLERLKPIYSVQDFGGTKGVVQSNPQAEGGVTGMQPVTATPGQVLTDAASRRSNAIAAGNLNVSRDRLAFDKATPTQTYDADRGIVVNTRTGTAAPVTSGGAPLAPKDKPLTEFQSKGQLFGTRAAEADKIINDLSAKGDNFPGSIKATAGEVPLVGGALAATINPLPGFMGGPSEAQQKVEQAQRNFINAVLRVESGAVISESEFDNAQKQYFPKRGDTPGVIANKAANRKSAIEGLRITSGPAGPRVAEAAAPTAQPTAADIDAELRRRKVIQ